MDGATATGAAPPGPAAPVGEEIEPAPDSRAPSAAAGAASPVAAADDDAAVTVRAIAPQPDAAQASASGNRREPSAPAIDEDGLDLKEHLADLERNLLLQALAQSDWVVARAAKLLKLQRTTLVEKMRKFQLARPGDASED
jgi:sigma-54 specific flagellar transcriptional regulator A